MALPRIRNQLTSSILNKLKEQGPPAQGQVGSISLDMTAPKNTTDGESNILQPVQKKKVTKQLSTGN